MTTIAPWRDCPFVAGRHYRVRKDFTALRDRFKEGEQLIFDSHAWSRYDGYTGYFFQQTGSERLRIWDIEDEADISVWKELFEEAPANAEG